MGASLSAIKTLIVPAVISLIIFVLSKYVILPFWRQYRNRYSQYLPLEAISSQTSSLRQRIQNWFTGLLVPSLWRRNLHGRVVVVGDARSDDGFESDEGEELADVDEETWREHSQLPQNDPPDSTRRLSRDLEEGFRSDSDEEDNSGNRSSAYRR